MLHAEEIVSSHSILDSSAHTLTRLPDFPQIVGLKIEIKQSKYFGAIKAEPLVGQSHLSITIGGAEWLRYTAMQHCLIKRL